MIIKRDDTFRYVFQLITRQSPDITNVGTGIFINHNDKHYLITASHVAKETTAQTIIAFGDDKNNCIKFLLSDFNSSLKWQHHQIADISALKIVITDKIKWQLNNRFFPFDHVNITSNVISRDAELTVVGFPNGLGIHGKYSPFTFRSYASSAFVTLQRADTKSDSIFFCLENPSVGGYSGGPIFDLAYVIVGGGLMTKDKTMLHGIMHGTIFDNTGGKIAMVTPSFYLKDIL